MRYQNNLESGRRSPRHRWLQQIRLPRRVFTPTETTQNHKRILRLRVISLRHLRNRRTRLHSAIRTRIGHRCAARQHVLRQREPTARTPTGGRLKACAMYPPRRAERHFRHRQTCIDNQLGKLAPQNVATARSMHHRRRIRCTAPVRVGRTVRTVNASLLGFARTRYERCAAFADKSQNGCDAEFIEHREVVFAGHAKGGVNAMGNQHRRPVGHRTGEQVGRCHSCKLT